MAGSPDFKALAERFTHADANALVLMGSYARDAAGPYSDIDLVRFAKNEDADLPGDGSHLIDGYLVVVSKVTPDQVEAAFEEPQIAVEVIQGLRQGRPLLDRERVFAKIQERANSFDWDAGMQAKANRWASRQMVGWIEEGHKGLEGLRRNDVGRMLHARFGCSWGLTRVMCVQRGVLLNGDNALFREVTGSMGPDTKWSRLCRSAFGVGPAGEPLSLRESVLAGLGLYALTAEMLAGVLNAEDAPLIAETAELIKRTLQTFNSQRKTVNNQRKTANPVDPS